MKKTTKKLSLSKQTISTLNDAALGKVDGGSVIWRIKTVPPLDTCGGKYGNPCVSVVEL
jgi:hypothetical protein